MEIASKEALGNTVFVDKVSGNSSGLVHDELPVLHGGDVVLGVHGEELRLHVVARHQVNLVIAQIQINVKVRKPNGTTPTV